MYRHNTLIIWSHCCFFGVFFCSPCSSFQRLSTASEGVMLGAAALRNLEILNNQVKAHLCLLFSLNQSLDYSCFKWRPHFLWRLRAGLARRRSLNIMFVIFVVIAMLTCYTWVLHFDRLSANNSVNTWPATNVMQFIFFHDVDTHKYLFLCKCAFYVKTIRFFLFNL